MPRIVEGRAISDIKLEKPFKLIVGGGSGAGKSEFIKKIVDKNFFSSSFSRIIYSYPNYLNDIPIEFKTLVEYRQGVLSEECIQDLKPNSLLIIDDLMRECAESNIIENLFAVTARKRNISVVLVTQNVYYQGKHFRNIRLNATGFVLFKFYAGVDINWRLIRDLGLQNIMPKPCLESIYSERYSYIFINIHPNRQTDFGIVASNIFKNNFSLYHMGMEYYAIRKSDFIKYFKIVESKKNTVKAIKNEIEVKQTKKHKRKEKNKFQEKKRAKIELSDTSEETTDCDSNFSDSDSE